MAKGRVSDDDPGYGEGFDSDNETGTGAAVERLMTLRSASGEITGLTAQELRSLSIEQLVSVAGPLTEASESIGTDQFGPILADKTQLVGVPFVLVHWNFYDGDMGEFVSMWVVDKDDRRFIVNDGSTGIYAQLRALTNKTGQDSMVRCPHGLRVSNYTYTDPQGKERPAQTFYIDTKL